MQWFPEDRKHLTAGQHGALFSWMSEYLWLWLVVCMGLLVWRLKYGVIALFLVVLCVVIIAIREYIGEHLYQMKTWGWSDWSMDQELAQQYKKERRERRNNK